MSKSWAERHPILTGALVGSIVPGIGTLAGAFGGVIYSMVESNDDPPASPPDNADKRQEQFEKARGKK